MQFHPAVRGLWSLGLSFLLFISLGAFSSAQDELPAEIDADGVQTLTRGPLHEAFASPTVADPEPGMIIAKRPPEDIKEQPPEYQPEGQNVQWFPGYWAWDEDREDFIWISGAWRDPPPGKRWVPGYWAEVPGGFQWVAGFWIDEAAEEFEYLKPPPQSLEQGPSVASPGDDHFYVPGTWNYVNNDYVWQAGYYAPYREDWVYVPAYWVWTPRGCIFVNGYWDWRVPRRGQIFAPVYFSPVVYQQPAYYYTPRCIINTSNLFVHLWVRPNYNHYYFGNYYGPTYANRHFTAWCNYQPRPRCYDPLLTYCNVHYRRQGVNYIGRMQGWNSHYDRHEHERPAKTWHDQVAHHRRDGNRPNVRTKDGSGPTTRLELGEDLRDIVRKPDPTRKWTKLDVAAKDVNKSSIDQVKQLHKMRLESEKVSFVGNRPGSGDKPNLGKPNLDKPINDKPDLTLPGVNRPGRPDRNPGDNDSKPAVEPGKVKDIARGDETKPGKFKLPKPALATTRPGNNKPAIKVPETPDRNIVNRPAITRPGNDLKLSDDKPNKIPGLRNPGSNPTNPTNTAGNNDLPTKRPGTRPDVGSKVPSLTPPGNAAPGNDSKPLVGNDGGRKTNPGSSSAAAAAQQRLEALRAQQNAANALRNPGNNPSGNLGGSKPNVPRIETPRIEKPRVETPKPNLDRGNSAPPRINLGGGNSPSRNEPVPRNLTPSNPPRISTPAPRINSAPRVEPRNNPAPRIEPRSNPAPRIEPRSNPAPRFNPAPRNEPRSNPGNSGNNRDSEKKRTR
jgi:hypothetical protein